MKKYIPSLTVVFCLFLTLPLHATLIIYGSITGTVYNVDNAGGLVRTTVGMPMWGTFSYDLDLLSPPNPLSGGQCTVGSDDANATFFIWSSAGEGGGGRVVNPFYVLNYLPYVGTAGNWPVIVCNPSTVAMRYDGQDVWLASVHYTITGGLPDAGETWLLLGLGLAGVTVARRCCRQISA